MAMAATSPPSRSSTAISSSARDGWRRGQFNPHPDARFGMGSACSAKSAVLLRRRNWTGSLIAVNYTNRAERGKVYEADQRLRRLKEGGSGWKSNPPWLPHPAPPILKTGRPPDIHPQQAASSCDLQGQVKKNRVLGHSTQTLTALPTIVVIVHFREKDCQCWLRLFLRRSVRTGQTDQRRPASSSQPRRRNC